MITHYAHIPSRTQAKEQIPLPSLLVRVLASPTAKEEEGGDHYRRGYV